MNTQTLNLIFAALNQQGIQINIMANNDIVIRNARIKSQVTGGIQPFQTRPVNPRGFDGMGTPVSMPPVNFNNSWMSQQPGFASNFNMGPRSNLTDIIFVGSGGQSIRTCDILSLLHRQWLKCESTNTGIYVTQLVTMPVVFSFVWSNEVCIYPGVIFVTLRKTREGLVIFKYETDLKTISPQSDDLTLSIGVNQYGVLQVDFITDLIGNDVYEAHSHFFKEYGKMMRSNKDENAVNTIDLNSVESVYNQKPVVERILDDMLPLLKGGNVNSDINSIENYMNGAFTKVMRIDSDTPPIWQPDMLLKYYTNNPRPVLMTNQHSDAVIKYIADNAPTSLSLDSIMSSIPHTVVAFKINTSVQPIEILCHIQHLCSPSTAK